MVWIPSIVGMTIGNRGEKGDALKMWVVWIPPIVGMVSGFLIGKGDALKM